ncbi:C40 family peptidase [Sphingomonas sp. 35-24ZXX]|uniref:C40 family peptidase n=1 Tax=Sphingomonas sp. 35-24ZXX TaxID=1545915 RepID=UPI00053C0320|nr:C40 family peptidase [Sphingomonas sp. 35-24ZXX]
MTDGDRLAVAALGMVGAPFRMHGRDPETGLDCVGLVAAALEGIGRSVDVPADYRLRGGSLPRFDGWARAAGLEPLGDAVPARAGDVLLCEVAPLQFHVMIDAGDRMVHAHIALGRVVASPAPAPWPVRRRWRLQQKG